MSQQESEALAAGPDLIVGELEVLICERCDDPIEEQFCTHHDLCPDCLWCCYDCGVEFGESRAYDDDRDEGP